MARPLTLLSTFASWFLGVSIAVGSGFKTSWASFIIGFTAMMFAASSTHFVNEYADFETDALTRRTAYNGGSGVLPSGLVPRSWALYSAILSAILGFFIEFWVWKNGIHLVDTLSLLILGIVGGWIYSIPPKLAWRGFGEVWNTLLGALLLPFYGFVQISGEVDYSVIMFILPVTFLAFNNLLAVTWTDREADEQVGKNTLATRLNPDVLRILHLSGLVSSLILLLRSSTPVRVKYVSMFAYPLMFQGWRSYTRLEVSIHTIWSLHVLIVGQSLAWLYIGFFGMY